MCLFKQTWKCYVIPSEITIISSNDKDFSSTCHLWIVEIILYGTHVVRFNLFVYINTELQIHCKAAYQQWGLRSEYTTF